MSDSWYRDPPSIPPYEDGFGQLWTIDGECLNPVHGCEPPAWLHELVMVEAQAQLIMGMSEAFEAFVFGEWCP